MVNYNIVEIEGVKYFLVKLEPPRYINNVLTKYLVCPMSQFERDVQNKVEVVTENNSNE